MFRKLFQQRERRAAAEVPPGAVVYAVGDVHGRRDLLGALLEAVLTEAHGADARAILVFVGDYIDRGPESNRVLDLLIELKAVRGLETHFLLGNHDETLLDFLRNPAVGPAWGDYGGRDTLMAYGVAPPSGRTDADAWAEAADALAAALPAEHRSFLAGLKDSVEIGDYFFAHAGAKPGVPLELQSHRDLLWIREPFLDDERPFEKVVVHGHTPAEAVHSDARRIGLDTGAYATGTLSAVRLEGEGRSFIQAVAEPGGQPRIVRLDAGERAPRAGAARG